MNDLSRSEPSPENAEMRNYADKLLSLTRLAPGWDSYGGVPTNAETAVAVGAFLRNVIAGKVSIVPMFDGGIQVEMHTDGWEVEISFEPPKEGEPMHDIEGIYERAKEVRNGGDY